eukprot:766555-Hanusia_phi.AAC.6
MKGGESAVLFVCFMALTSSGDSHVFEDWHKVSMWKAFVDERPWSSVRGFYESVLLDEVIPRWHWDYREMRP